MPPWACSKTPARAADGARERAPLVSEERRLDERRGDGGAVEDDEGACARGPLLVERLGEHLLARAGLALDDDGHVGLREALAQRVEPAHRVARAEQATERRLRRQLAPR